METMIYIDLIKQDAFESLIKKKKDAFGSLCKHLELYMVDFCTLRLLGQLVVSCNS